MKNIPKERNTFKKEKQEETSPKLLFGCSISNILYFFLFLFCVAALTALDQLTKAAAADYIKGKQAIVVIDGVLEFVYLENSGIAWGLFSGARNFVLIITIIMMGLFCYMVLKTPLKKRYLPVHIVAILLTSGAAGNFIDRLLFGRVRDFIYFKLIDFPVFNIADIFVTMGMIFTAFLVFFVYQEEDFYFLGYRKK